MNKPRKRYRPKPVAYDPVLVAMNHAMLLPDERRRRLLDPILSAFTAAREGKLTEPLWRDLADAINVGQQLALRGICRVWVGSDGLERLGDDTFQAGMATMAEIIDRAEARGSWTLYPAEIAQLDTVVELHRQQLLHCSQGELMESIAAVRRWVGEAQRGNRSPGARVAGAAA